MAQKAQSASVIRNVGTNIRFIQRGRGKTDDQMAQVICRSRRTWYDRMQDPGTFTMVELVAVCKFLGTSLERVMGDPNEIYQ